MTQIGMMNLQQMEEMAGMDEVTLDRMPFGAIQLDPDGNILRFNDHEARLTGRDPRKVIGRNFFKDVAPCTNVREFAGRFREGVKKGSLHEVFPYRFDFEMAPRDVTVTLFYSEKTKAAWVFVRECEPVRRGCGTAGRLRGASGSGEAAKHADANPVAQGTRACSGIRSADARTFGCSLRTASTGLCHGRDPGYARGTRLRLH